MPRPVIRKTLRGTPKLADYGAACHTFRWEDARSALDGLPGGRGLNIAHEAVDRHAAGGRRDRVALCWLGRTSEVRDLTYGELRSLTNRFANVLAALGVRMGDRVFALAGRIPELYVAALGTLKHRAVFCPLFSAFGPEPIRARLAIGEARVLVTTESLYRRKVEALRTALPTLQHVLLVGDEHAPTAVAGTHDLDARLAAAGDAYEIGATSPEDLALLHFTSGTTGTPKGAMHVHEAVVAHDVTGRLALDLHADDVFWCTADPGWVTGTSYGIVAPLTNGVTSVVDEREFEVERWYRTLQDQRVTVWYTAPTAIRMLMKAGGEIVRPYDLSALRFLASVGEPLNAEAVVWSQETFGIPFHDNWWQTETGGIMIANFLAMDVRPGSMGRPLPGVEAAIVRRHGPEDVEVITEPDVQGELALRAGWRHGRARRRGGGENGRRTCPRGRRPVSSRGAHVPIPRPLDVRPRAVPLEAGGRGVEAPRSHPGAVGADGLVTPAELDALGAATEAEVAGAVTAAEAAPWEPVSDLARDVHGEGRAR